MLSTTSKRRTLAMTASLVGLIAPLSLASPAAAEVEQSYFFEETAEAFWAVPHTCADGSVVSATLLVRSTRDFEAPDTEDADPTARVQYLAVCPGGLSFSWAAPAAPATITSADNLKSVHTVGSGIARDNLGGTHQVSFDVTYTAVGALETSVDSNVAEGFSVNTSTRKQREAVADGVVVFDGNTLVDGANNHPTRPAPFIRTDEERTTRMP